MPTDTEDDTELELVDELVASRLNEARDLAIWLEWFLMDRPLPDAVVHARLRDGPALERAAWKALRLSQLLREMVR